MHSTDDPRCTFTYRDGRRCRNLGSAKHPPLCPHHLRKACLDAGALPPKPPPLGAPGTLDTPWAVRRAIKRLFREVLAGTVPPRQAAVLTQLARTLLIETRRARRHRKQKTWRGKPAATKAGGSTGS